MAETRRHPDVFSPREAFAYVLGIDVEYNDNTLETWRTKHGLFAVKLTLTYYYHRRDLDALIDRLFKVANQTDQTNDRKPLRMAAGGSR